MIYAYQEIYLNKTQSLLGDAFDYAINIFELTSSDFVSMFLVSSYSKRIAKGDLSIIQGRSGIELVIDVCHEITNKYLDVEPEFRNERSAEYWVGWAIAYYQWYSNRTFDEIFKVFSFEDLKTMYYPLHEADIGKFLDIADKRIRDFFHDTNLKRIRKSAGLNQAELARIANVNIRSIQMYEQRNIDINKASFETVYRLSKALGCSLERLYEN